MAFPPYVLLIMTARSRPLFGAGVIVMKHAPGARARHLRIGLLHAAGSGGLLDQLGNDAGMRDHDDM